MSVPYIPTEARQHGVTGSTPVTVPNRTESFEESQKAFDAYSKSHADDDNPADDFSNFDWNPSPAELENYANLYKSEGYSSLPLEEQKKARYAAEKAGQTTVSDKDDKISNITDNIAASIKQSEQADNNEANKAETDSNEANKSETDSNEAVARKRYRDSMTGIWDAFREGKIDKGTALYFTLDAISKLASNTGKDLGNMAAAFTGGTMNNERDNSLWSQRRDKMFENELGSEVESEANTPANRALQHDLNSLSMEEKNLFAKDLENWIANQTKGITVGMLSEQLKAMGYANISNAINTLTDKEALEWANSEDPVKRAAGNAYAAAKHIDVGVNVGPTGINVTGGVK